MKGSLLGNEREENISRRKNMKNFRGKIGDGKFPSILRYFITELFNMETLGTAGFLGAGFIAKFS